MNLIPAKMFLTKGLGMHKDKLTSFEAALRNAGIAKCNLVRVSSIIPPGCKLVTKEYGINLLKPGEITFVVMSQNQTNEPNRLVSASVGIAIPKEKNSYGYLSEHNAFGETAKKSGEYAEDLAATMLATTLGIPFNPQKAWDERKKEYKASGYIFKTSNVSQSARGNKNGLWTTVIAAAVLIF